MSSEAGWVARSSFENHVDALHCDDEQNAKDMAEPEDQDYVKADHSSSSEVAERWP